MGYKLNGIVAIQCAKIGEYFRQSKKHLDKEKEGKEEMDRRGNGYLDEAMERLRDEQEKDRDPQTAYEDQMTEENQDSNE